MESILSYVFFAGLVAFIAYKKIPAVTTAIDKLIKGSK